MTSKVLSGRTGNQKLIDYVASKGKGKGGEFIECAAYLAMRTELAGKGDIVERAVQLGYETATVRREKRKTNQSQ